MKRALLGLLCLGTICGFAGTECSASDSRKSLALSCFEKPFLSISASAPERNVLPAVRLTLTDPLGRTAGNGNEHAHIPHAKYGEVVQIPKAPDRSRVLAIEVCDARQGIYEIKVREKGSDRYRLELTGSNQPKDTATLVLNHISRDARTLIYRFTFKMQGERVNIKWLDKTGKPTDLVEINEW